LSRNAFGTNTLSELSGTSRDQESRRHITKTRFDKLCLWMIRSPNLFLPFNSGSHKTTRRAESKFPSIPCKTLHRTQGDWMLLALGIYLIFEYGRSQRPRIHIATHARIYRGKDNLRLEGIRVRFFSQNSRDFRANRSATSNRPMAESIIDKSK